MIPLQPFLVAATSVFFAILFLQSGFDKVTDRKSNAEFHAGHFADSPLKKFAPVMLVMITIMEICCGLMFLAGLIYFFMKEDSTLSFYASCLASLNFISLFFGQRISKDYKGAATLVPYFILSLISMYVSNPVFQC